jgi:hypothetical protein
VRRRSFVSCLRPGLALADGDLRSERVPPPLQSPDNLYSELDDLLMIDAPLAPEHASGFQLDIGPLPERGR